MSDLHHKTCLPCEGGIAALTGEQARHLLTQLHSDWQLSADNKQIRRELRFKNFYHTMNFVNAVAYLANREDHHPDLSVGYNYCHIVYSTHAIDGLSENDFICAAKIDALTAA